MGIYMLPINYTDKQIYCQKAYTVSILQIITSEELEAGNISGFKEIFKGKESILIKGKVF